MAVPPITATGLASDPASALKGTAANGSGLARGGPIFSLYCAACHGDRGAGGPFTTVPLKDVAPNINDENIAILIAEGLQGTVMPPFEKTLTKGEIADVIRFVRSW